MSVEFDSQLWKERAKVEMPWVIQLVDALQSHGAIVNPRESRIRCVGSLSYIVKFFFKEEGACATIFLDFLDWQTTSDVVITNMTVLPDQKTNRGSGTRAMQVILAWARENGLVEVRATQVGRQAESFWVKNGFFRDAEPNPCNDFVWKSPGA